MRDPRNAFDLSSDVPFRTPLDKYPGRSGGPLCETLGTNFTYLSSVLPHSRALDDFWIAALSHFASTWASRYDWFQHKQSKCHRSNSARWCFGMASRRLACLACLPACLPARLQAGLLACLPARFPAMPALIDAHVAAKPRALSLEL